MLDKLARLTAVIFLCIVLVMGSVTPNSYGLGEILVMPAAITLPADGTPMARDVAYLQQGVPVSQTLYWGQDSIGTSLILAGFAALGYPNLVPDFWTHRVISARTEAGLGTPTSSQLKKRKVHISASIKRHPNHPRSIA